MTLWQLIVYLPMAQMVWGASGLMSAIPAVDFAGGTVVHITSAVSALVAAIYLGKRKGVGSEGRAFEIIFLTSACPYGTAPLKGPKPVSAILDYCVLLHPPALEPL